MIVRQKGHQWLVIYGPFEQLVVVGTKAQAKGTEQLLRNLHKQTVDALPWYCRWIARLNMWMIDIAHA